ncbi:hypothetical protein BJ085DRAFT_31705 [Dimargaris cristalligena]|uniref:Short chain dehydrogenase n=1 Tax=Dimargaris cristalligena TaxID=215637 RepID=A0A4P9ZSX9_9FUNG|nr:hypothetical protein BJ085DRAFT_31705 [Dimargaris cristalligena]|eukprot:RKP36535.1 hypothetical protein BJ085DRAFT_31705 [Dimargaris cristalligena]
MFPASTSLQDKVLVIVGSPRGLTHAFATTAAQQGAKIALIQRVCARDTEFDTVYSETRALRRAGATVLPFIADVRNPQEIAEVMASIFDEFGSLDYLVSILGSLQMIESFDTAEKDFSSMLTVDTQGTRICIRAAVPYLLQSQTPHVLISAPPLMFNDDWNMANSPYSMTKFAISMCARGLMSELSSTHISINAIWPRIMIHVDELNRASGYSLWRHLTRRPDIVVDAAYWIFSQPRSDTLTGRFWYDEDVLRQAGITDFSHYQTAPPAPVRTVTNKPSSISSDSTAHSTGKDSFRFPRKVSSFFSLKNRHKISVGHGRK